MGCCNEPPRGGTTNVKLLVKCTLVFFVVIFAIAWLFG